MTNSQYFWIPRNEAGTRSTLYTMLDIARAGYLEARPIHPEKIDRVLRASWKFVSDGQYETIRTVNRMMVDLSTHGAFLGDCDDAAVMAAAMLLRWKRLVLMFDKKTGSPGAHAWFVAMRPPKETAFAHVFVVAQMDDGHTFRIDPTVPPDAPYAGWESMLVPIF